MLARWGDANSVALSLQDMEFPLKVIPHSLVNSF
jgi:hypothetical protein